MKYLFNYEMSFIVDNTDITPVLYPAVKVYLAAMFRRLKLVVRLLIIK
jgi:subtilase family serine protease